LEGFVATRAYGFVQVVELLWFPDGQHHRFFNGALDPLLRALGQSFLRIGANWAEFFLSPW